MPKSKSLQQAAFNWPAKIFSLVAAILIFLVIQVSIASDRSFYIPLEVVVPAQYQVETSFPSQVKITVNGPEDEIFRIIPEQISGRVDFSDVLTEGVHARAVELDTKRVVGISPMVTFRPDPESVKIYLGDVNADGGSE